MLVAIPTAMPPAPLTSMFGKRAGKTVGSCDLCRHNCPGNRRYPCRCRPAEIGCRLVHPHFGVAHRSGVVAIHRPKVTLPVKQVAVTSRNRLCHPHQRVIDRSVAVRVVFTHHCRRRAARICGRTCRDCIAALVHRVRVCGGAPVFRPSRRVWEWRALTITDSSRSPDTMFSSPQFDGH